MTITAKFSSTCPVCRKPIRPGDTIEWAGGQKSRHATCPTPKPPGVAKPPAPTPTSRAPAQHTLDTLRTAFKLFGEHPAGAHTPTGERVLLHTSATLFADHHIWTVIDTEWIWLLEPALQEARLHNIHASDPPQSGWRLPFDPTLAATLRRLRTAPPSPGDLPGPPAEGTCN